MIKIGAVTTWVIIILLFFVNLLRTGGFQGLEHLFALRYDTFINFKAWARSIRDTVEILSLGRGIYCMYGTQLPVSASAGILTVACVVVSFCLCALSSLITNSCLCGILYKAHMDTSQASIDTIFSVRLVSPLLTIVPQGLGFLAAAQLWSSLYFLVLLVICMNNQIVNVFMVERCIIEGHPKMIRYRHYLLAVICIILTALTAVFSSNEIYNLSVSILVDDVRAFELLNTIALALIVCYIYGVQRLCDDIHFFMGSQPTKFWKICWIILPVILVVPLSQHILDPSERIRATSIIYYSIIFLLYVPVLATIILQLYKHLKNHNLVGLFQPQERWGPADPEERHLRRLFNPRQEIRSRRRNENCQHKCLLGSKVLRKLIIEEGKARQEREDIGDHYQHDSFQNDYEENFEEQDDFLDMAIQENTI